MKINLRFCRRYKYAINALTIFLIIVLGAYRVIAQTPCVGDSTATDFNAGLNKDNLYISQLSDGEVILKPLRGSEFSDLPSTDEWNSYAWDLGGGSTVSGGILTVDGARFNSDPETLTFGPGTTLEFVATFGTSSFQHIGFGSGPDLGGSSIYNNGPWAMFSTSNDGILRMRTNDGANHDVDVPNGNDLIGSPHDYKIEWTTAGGFNYYIDGSLLHSESTTIATSMRPAISDFTVGGAVITVDWIHVSPYTSSASFESRILDGGTQTAWGKASITVETPANTTLSIDVRTGNTIDPNDGSWSAYTTVSDGDDIAGASRYIQYRANLATTDASVTPVLEAFSISDCAACKIKAVISDQHNISCNGKNDGSITISATKGTPPYQYKRGTNGSYQTDPTFSNLPVKSLTFFVLDANGCTRSVKATITQPAAVTIGVVNQTNVSCMGGNDGSITVQASGGTGTTYQYKKGKNGSYSDPQTGAVVFSNLKAKTYNIFAKDENGCESSTSVTITEPGTPCVGIVNDIANAENISLDDKLNSNDLNIKISPNPSTTDFSLTLTGSNKENVDIKITDMYGKNIYRTSGPVNNLYRFGNEFSPGVYILQVTQGSKSKTQKIVKQ